MQYAIEAVIDAELPYDLNLQLMYIGAASYTLDIFERIEADGVVIRFTHVTAYFGGGAPKPQERNKRRGLERDLVKQIEIYGGQIILHECYHEEGAPCVLENTTIDNKRPNPVRRGRLVSRVTG